MSGPLGETQRDSEKLCPAKGFLNDLKRFQFESNLAWFLAVKTSCLQRLFIRLVVSEDSRASLFHVVKMLWQLWCEAWQRTIRIIRTIKNHAKNISDFPSSKPEKLLWLKTFHSDTIALLKATARVPSKYMEWFPKQKSLPDYICDFPFSPHHCLGLAHYGANPDQWFAWNGSRLPWDTPLYWPGMHPFVAEMPPKMLKVLWRFHESIVGNPPWIHFKKSCVIWLGRISKTWGFVRCRGHFWKISCGTLA